MAFGGAVKLTGESEYRKALNNITMGLKEVAAQMKQTSVTYDKNDKSATALTAKSKDLSAKMELQKSRIVEMNKQYKALTQQYDKNVSKHASLLKSYESEKAKLDSIGKELGENSTEYQNQKKIVEQYEKDLQKSTRAQEANEKTLANMRIQIKNAETDYIASEKALNGLTKELEASEKAARQTGNAYNTLKGHIDKQESDLESLKQEYASVIITQGKNSDEAQELARRYRELTGDLQSNKNKLNEVESELDDLSGAARDAGNEARDASEGFTVIKGVISNLASQAITAALNGLKKLGGALVDVGKQAVGSYAQYEQLVGGVETLFKDSADIVKGYASEAYRTAGMSANTYMETVTSFSASLIQSLGGDTKKAAEYAHTAIVDMSDNANKMGSSIESIQNAYQGFAKQNYSMLDNLKLGYGGTQKEMFRLLQDAAKLDKKFAETAKFAMDEKGHLEAGYADIVRAIHIVQNQMGIMGTTSLEAADTIEGSTGSMRAAWENLLTAIADDNADLGKSIDIFVNSAVTAGKNMVPRIKAVVDNIKKLITSIVTEVFPKLKREVPELRPLIETFEWFIDNRQLVVGAIQAMVGAFVVAKVASWTKAMSDGVKSMIEFVAKATLSKAALDANTAAQAANTTAQVAGTTATTGLTTATNLLNAAWKANPIGLVVAGISALIGVISFLTSKTDEQTEAEKKQQEAMEAKKAALEAQREEIRRNAEAWDELVEAQQNNINVGMTELENYSNLWDELQGIVDQNGKVKKGYEERASFITSTLSEALGIEVENVKGVIQKYDELKKSIDDVMEKKRAQIILDAQESLYAEAIKKQEEATRNLMSAKDELATQETAIGTLRSELADKERKEQEALNLWRQNTNDQYLLGLYNQAKAETDKAQKAVDAKQKEINAAEETYNQQLDLFNEYAYNISTYEDNLSKFHAGKYDEMTQATWNYVKEYQSAGDAEKAMLKDQIKVTGARLDELKRLRKSSGNAIYDDQIKAAEKELAAQKKKLKSYNEATASGLKDVKLKWSENLAAQLSDITGKDIKFKEAGKGNVKMYVDGIPTGEKKSKDEMAKLIGATIKEITKKDKDAKKAGEDLIDGVNKGIKNQDKQSGVFTAISNFGSSLLSKLKASLKEKSPSKATEEMGVFLLQGITKGVNKEQARVYTRLSTFGNKMLNVLYMGSKNYKTAGESLAKSFDKGVESALKSSKTRVNGLIDTYFKNLQSKNEKSQKELQAKIRNTDDKEAKKTLNKQLDTLNAHNKKLSKLYNEFGRAATNEFNRAIEAATEGATDKLQERVKKLSATMQSQLDTVKRSMSSMRERLGETELYTKDEDGNVILSDIKAQTKTLTTYSKNINRLKGKISDGLMNEITSLSVDDAVSYTNELLKLRSRDLAKYNRDYVRTQRKAKAISQAFYASELKTIKRDYTSKIKAEFKTAKDEMQNIGKQTMQGFIKGMKATRFTKEIKSVADGIVKQMKKALGIHSPSRVFRDEIGKNAALGIGEGFTREMQAVTREMQAAIPTTMNAEITSENVRRKSEDPTNIINAFKTALSEMKIELDDEVAGKFVEKTVARAVYS